jgi:hypothetical protein
MHDVVRHAKNRFLRPGSDIGGGVVELERLEPDTALLHYYCITSSTSVCGLQLLAYGALSS